MRIAVFHDLPSGGAKRALYEYTRELVKNHTVDVYAPSTADEKYLDLHDLGVQYHLYSHNWESGHFINKLPILRNVGQYYTFFTGLHQLHMRIAQDIDNGGYDIAFVHHSQYTQSPYILSYLKTPSVYYCQEPRRRSFEYSVKMAQTTVGFKAKLKAAIWEPRMVREDIASARAATQIVANSFYSVESIKRAYGRYAKVCYLGVNTSLFGSSAKYRSNYIMSVGALDRVKGHDLVVLAAGEVNPSIRPTVIIVADRGSDEYGKELVRLADKAGVNLKIKRAISDKELASLYSRARVVVCAAELEPFGFTPIESMACGTPVIAVMEGGYRETVINNLNGLLVERDPHVVAAAIIRLITDDRLWQKLQDGALSSTDKWGWEIASQRLEAIFEEITGSRASA